MKRLVCKPSSKPAMNRLGFKLRPKPTTVGDSNLVFFCYWRVDIGPPNLLLVTWKRSKYPFSFLLAPTVPHHPFFISFFLPSFLSFFPFFISPFLLASLLASQSPPYLQYFLCICQHNEIMIPLYYTMGAWKKKHNKSMILLCNVQWNHNFIIHFFVPPLAQWNHAIFSQPQCIAKTHFLCISVSVEKCAMKVWLLCIIQRNDTSIVWCFSHPY